MIRYLLSRIGCLMLVVGSIILVVGMAALRSGEPAFTILLLGAAVFLLGFMLWQRLRKKSRRNTRFSLFRRKRRDKPQDPPKEDDGWGY